MTVIASACRSQSGARLWNVTNLSPALLAPLVTPQRARVAPTLLVNSRKRCRVSAVDGSLGPGVASPSVVALRVAATVGKSNSAAPPPQRPAAVPCRKTEAAARMPPRGRGNWRIQGTD